MSKHISANLDTKKYCHQSIRFIEIVRDESIAMLARHGETIQLAKKLGRECVTEVCRQLQGTVIYIGKNSAFDTQMRNWAIKEDFHHGNSLEQLASKYSLSTRQIHKIVHRKNNIDPAIAATTGVPAIAIVATRMMLKTGIEQDDAVNAARGLLAVVAARLGGTAVRIPLPRFVAAIIKQIEIVRYHQSGKSIGSLVEHFGLTAEGIRDIIKNYPAASIPEVSDLPKIKTRLFNMATSFSGHDEIKCLLESASGQISRAEGIIAKLKEERTQQRR